MSDFLVDLGANPTARNMIKQLGLQLSLNGNQLHIVSVAKNSDAAKKGLRKGDIILEVNSTKTSDVRSVQKLVDQSIKLGRRSVLLKLERGDQYWFYAVSVIK